MNEYHNEFVYPRFTIGKLSFIWMGWEFAFMSYKYFFVHVTSEVWLGPLIIQWRAQ